jgi:cystathionine beta-lyase/cystathionine gamma-synthase
VDFADLSKPETLASLLRPTTALIFFETPTNPMMRLVDIKKAVQCAKEKAPKALVVVDNTFMGPLYQSPIDLGADVVLHSLTKYLGGHGDVVGGALLGVDAQLYEDVKLVQRGAGSFLQPFECFLAMRGIRTLHVRMERAQQTALAVAQFLEGHDRIAEILYPGLASFPQASLKECQMTGSSGMISFTLRDGGRDAALEVLSKLRLWRAAVSLGSVTSYAQHPATMTHATVPPEVRMKLGITDSMLRLSCGVESAADLIKDLRLALE